MILGILNSTDSPGLTPTCVLSRKVHYRSIDSTKLYSRHLRYGLQSSSTRQDDLNNVKNANFDRLFFEGGLNIKIEIPH